MIYKYTVFQSKVYSIKLDLIYDKSYSFYQYEYFNSHAEKIIYDY